jgi:hypothetical protein
MADRKCYKTLFLAREVRATGGVIMPIDRVPCNFFKKNIRELVSENMKAVYEEQGLVMVTKLIDE